MDQRKRIIISRILICMIILTIAFIWGNSLLDRGTSSALSTGLLEYIKPLLEFLGIDTDSDHWLRKFAHFCEFALLGTELSLHAVFNGRHKIRNMLFRGALTLAVAVADETIQRFTGRYPHILDVMLDFSGGICGIAVACLIFTIINKKYKSSAV